MGKEPQNETSKAKSQKNVKSAPTWREKLAEYDINNIYEGRTCEIILMAELTITFSDAIVLFNVGAERNPTNVVKSVNFESFINDIQQAKQSKPKADKSKSKNDPTVALFQSAAIEAIQFLNTNQPIPLELMAQLLKLKIINMINEDVTLRDQERILEIEKLELANEAPDKKGKAEKATDVKKGKGKSAAIKLPVEERKLFFLIAGFYNPYLIQELCTIGLALSAILELSSPECIIFKEKYAAAISETPRTSVRTLSDSVISSSIGEVEEDDEEVLLFVNQYYYGSKESVCYSVFGGEQSISSITSSIHEKILALNNFWDKIYEELEGELQAKCLESAAHVRINPLSATRADKNPHEIFLEISKEIVKISDVKRQHLHYLHNVKICEIGLEPENMPITSSKTYKKLMDVVPLDCFTTGLLLHCLVEEVCSRVPDPKSRQTMKANSKYRKESKPIQGAKTSLERNVSAESKNESEENNKTLRKLANYVIQYKKAYSPLLGRSAITYRQYKFDLKLNLKITKEPFIIHESSTLEYKLNTYHELSKQLLKINVDILKKCPAALLWNLYSQLQTIEVIYKNHQLETWRRLLNLSLDEIQCALAAIQLDLLPCSAPSTTTVEAKSSLQVLFPEKNESEVLKTAMPKIKYIQTPEISLATLNEKQSCLRIPEVPYSNIPNIYEAKNIPTYLWYEKLPRIVMLQQLQKANSEYVCVDHKYCPYNDALILRYHNNLDMFGINSRIWTQSLRTPVCFRDFCKYIIHDEAQWLEKEEDNYQKTLKENPIPTEEIYQDTIQRQRASIKRLTMECAKSGDPYSFLAYDLSEARIQLTGATTIFHSMDGYKVTVDRTSFIGKPKNLSLNIAIAGHNLILHYNKATLNEPFTFHFCLSDGAIIAFGKPTRLNKPEIKIAEKSKISKPKPKLNAESAFQPREKKYYYVTEIKRWYLKSINAPSVARQSLLLDENRMFEFLEQTKKNFARSFKTKRKGNFRKSTSLKCNVENSNTSKNSKDMLTLYVSPTIQKNGSKIGGLKTHVTTLGATTAQAECSKIVKKIEEAKKLQVPMFKVYSSKLHKFEYIKRIKSYIHIKVGKHAISLPCKHPMYKTSRDVEVVKVFPVKLADAIFYNNNCYDIKVSLPSGLLIYTLPGANNEHFNIRQKYIEKSPLCKNIVNEDSRTFTRNGHVVIKKSDGTLDIFSASGQIIHCEIPHSTVHTHTNYRIKTRHKNNQGKKIKLTKFESKLYRIVNWRRRHIIGGAESRYFKYRRINLRQHKLQTKNSKNIFVMQKKCNPSFEFTLITQDGKQLKVTNTHVKKQNTFFQSTYKDGYDDQYNNLRDDGTINFIYGGGIFTTQFSDKTKITSWFAEAPELIMFEDEDSFFGMESMDSFVYNQISDNGWVLIQMFYKFEHPNYATILYSSDNYETEINLPNNVIINVTEYGHYFLDINQIISSVINDELVYLESKSCDTCMQRSISVLNIKPLYDGIYHIDENIELLKTCDSYEKVFLVNYNGKCFRNSNYVKNRTNRAECYQHDKEDYQQLFILNRDLSGSKFWDVKAYRKRVIEATENSNTVLQYYGKNAKAGDYTSLELRTYKYQLYHMCFINQYLINDIVLSQNNLNPPLPAYTTLCHICSMPKECMTKLLEASMIDNNEIKAKFPKSDNKKTLCKCISQISRENLKLKRKSGFDEHLRKISSALLVLKKWYTCHDLSKPYVPSNSNLICKCKSGLHQEKLETIQSKKIFKDTFDVKQQTSLEIVPERFSSVSITEPHKIPHKTVCECNIPASFVCKCNSTTTNVNDKEETKYFKTERKAESENNNLEANQRISSIKGWSVEDDFLNDFYISPEESMPVLDVRPLPVSDTEIQKQQFKPPPCECNSDKKVHQRPVAPKHRPRKSCSKDTCKKQKRPLSTIKETSKEASNTSLYSKIHGRQAGGADPPAKFSNMRKSEETTSRQKRNLLRQLQRKIIEIVLASSATVEVSAEKAEHYKIAVAINIMSNISRARLNISELINLFKKLNDMNPYNCKMLSAEQLSRLILSLSKHKTKLKDVGRNSILHCNSASKLITRYKYQSNITKSAIRTMEPRKLEQDFNNLRTSNKKLQPQKPIRDKTKNVDKMETFTKNVLALLSMHKKI